MKYLVSIATDSLRICDEKPVEAPTSMEAALAALHYKTSAHGHLEGMPLAHLRIEVWPEGMLRRIEAAEPNNVIPFTLNQELGNC